MAADSVEDTDNVETHSGVDPLRLAWGVILLAFTVFCVTCAASVLGIHYFLFGSSLSLNAVLQVGRGTVGVRQSGEVEQAESGQRVLSNGMLVRTDQTDLLSQAIISFRDPNYDNSLVAAITLKGDTAVRLRTASRPRFRWSTPIYHGELDVSGEVDVLIAGELNRDVQIIIHTQRGAEIRLEASGRYLVNVSANTVQVTNRRGQAVLITPDRRTAQSISTQQTGTFDNEHNTIQVMPTLIELVTNGDLKPFAPDETMGNVPAGWSCTNGPSNNLPSGSYRADVSPDGRPSFRLMRDEAASTNGYTRCEALGLDHIGDVTSYNYLAIQATFLIHYQSLSRCGTVATECPFTMIVEYVDSDGQAGAVWRRGFYARDDPGPAANYPLRCDICIDNHVRIYDNVWYTFTSENLFNLLDRHPQYITGVVFFAEGHQYDVFVDEVTLLAGNVQNLAENTSGDQS